MKKFLCLSLVLILLLNCFFIITADASSSSLSMPKNLKAKALNETSIKLTWSKVSGAKSYDVYKFNDTTQQFEKIINTISKSYTDKGLQSGTVYRYEIQAIRDNLVSPFSKSISSITIPSTPADLKMVATSNSVTLNWSASTGATKYKIYMSTNAIKNYKLKITTASISCLITKLKNGTNYYFKISALNSSGESIKSNCFAIKAVDPPPAPIVYNGSGDQVISGINLTSKFYTAQITHDGATNFIVKDYFGESYNLLVNKIGAYNGTVLMQNIGAHSIDITADGNWSVTLLPVAGTTNTSFSGHGDFVTPYFTMPSNKAWTFTHDGSSNFIIWAYQWTGQDLIINKIGAYTGSKIVSLSASKNTFFEINADGNWTITK